MTKRYLKVEVCKELHSEVYLAVDDADPRFSSIFDMAIAEPKNRAPSIMEELKKTYGYRLNKLARGAAEREAEELDSLDWSDAATTANWFASEVKPEDAEQYGILDLTKKIAREQQHPGGQDGCESLLRHD